MTPAFTNRWPQPGTSRKPGSAPLLAAALLLFAVTIVYGSALSGYQLFMASLITVIGVIPIVAYLRHPDGSYPLVQFSLLFHGVTFGAVCFSSQIDWMGLNEESVDHALELACLGMVGLSIGYGMSRLGGPRLPDSFSNIPLQRTLPWALALTLVNVSRYLLPQINQIPTIPNILMAGGWTGIALLLIAQLRGQATRFYQLCLAGLLLIEAAQRLASGALGALAILFVVVAFVFWRERGRIPLLPVVLGLATLAVFHPVKERWRQSIWYGEQQMGVVDKLSTLADLTEDYYLNGQRTTNDASQRNIRRLANTPTLAWVTYIAPRFVDYWKGYSYNALWYSLVPRFLYPEKPVATIGNEFGRRYLLLGPKDYVTSYNLPWLVEFYVNFGEFAVLPGMLLSGLLLGWVSKVLGHASDLQFAIGLAATHQLFFAGSNFALMWGNVILVTLFFGFGARLVFRR